MKSAVTVFEAFDDLQVTNALFQNVYHIKGCEELYKINWYLTYPKIGLNQHLHLPIAQLILVDGGTEKSDARILNGMSHLLRACLLGIH